MTKTCLVVDDNVETVDILRRILERAGHHVLTAYDGQAGLEQAEMNIPDIILLDLMMPVLDGYAMNARLKESTVTREIPVIIMSARSGMAPMFDASKGSNVEGYLVKPFSAKDLLALIDSVFAKRSQ